jgi:hypothetical protein
MEANEKDKRDYEKAKTALEKIAFSLSDDVTDDQRITAEDAIEDLIDNYIDKAIIEFKERSSKYKEFINTMENLITEMGGNPILDGLQTLQGIVNNSSNVIKEIETNDRDR